jgi:putative transposase
MHAAGIVIGARFAWISFMRILKAEAIYIEGCETYGDVTARLSRFIGQVDNAKRIHSAPGCVSPNPFEARLARQAA